MEEELITEREEVMVSATGSIPARRKARFLKPTVSAMEASRSFKLPFLSPKCSWPMDVRFNGWRNPQKKWADWVDRMQAKHGDLWEKAGISEAIQVSKFKFKRNDELIYGVCERWCPDSNTFVFPWGEATLTLEDMLILGGFSVLGSSAFGSISGADMEEAEKSLRAVPKSLRNHRKWLDLFMDSGSSNEHDAFLCLWISRFVIPGNEVDRIGDHVFSVAVSLSRGVRVALAPTALANIYRDLGLLKETMALASSLEENKERNVLAVSLWAPLQFVQLWIWERFLVFRPEPNFLKSGEVRAARWRGLGRDEVGNVRPIIDSCGEAFMWRPYCLNLEKWSFPEFYKEREGYHVLMCEKLESYVRCLRGGFLVGTDGIEPYQPHRVAMQFGLDQDLPALIPRCAEAAWEDYAKDFSGDFCVYLPGRLSEGDLSIQYKQWWDESVVVPVQSFAGLVKGLRTRKIRCLRFCSSSNVVGIKMEAYDDDDVPPGFPRKDKDDPPIPASMFVDQIKAEPISPTYPAAIYLKNSMSGAVKIQNLNKCLKVERI